MLSTEWTQQPVQNSGHKGCCDAQLDCATYAAAARTSRFPLVLIRSIPVPFPAFPVDPTFDPESTRQTRPGRVEDCNCLDCLTPRSNNHTFQKVPHSESTVINLHVAHLLHNFKFPNPISLGPPLPVASQHPQPSTHPPSTVACRLPCYPAQTFHPPPIPFPSLQPSKTVAMSYTAKIFRTANAPNSAPSEVEQQIAQALLDLQTNVPDLTSELAPLQISAAREVDVKGGKKAIVVFVPVPQVKAFHKIQQRLTRELEKKLSDRFIVFVAQRRVLPKESRNSKGKLGQKRPRSRTLTAVHEKILEDLVFPSEITGKRTRVAHDGSKLTKVFLDAKDANVLEYKLDTFASVYKALAGKDVAFEFPVTQAE